MRLVVVGAGIAGLTAATELVARGHDVVVLEARDRVGGRIHGIEIGQQVWADAGAAYLGDRHTALLALVENLGLTTTPTVMKGRSRFALHGEPVTCEGRFPPLSAVALGELFDDLDEVTRSVRVDAPWLGPNAAALDRLTVAEWADARLKHPDARLFFPLFLGEMMAADARDISVLHMAFYLQSGGGIKFLNAFEGGAQAARVSGGACRLCAGLARRLAGRVKLREAVLAIDQENGKAVVSTKTNTFQGDAVIVALPPLLADAIEYRPRLPVRRAGPLTAAGCVVKVNLIFDSQVWHRDGLSGWSVNVEGPMLSTVDDSPTDGSIGVLTGFITGSEARRFAAVSAVDQRTAVFNQLHRLFGELPEPRAFHVTDWLNADYSRGCYAALFGPADWMMLGPHLTRPHGRVHWAGTETSTEFFGLMEGAIRSGKRAAGEIVRDLVTA